MNRMNEFLMDTCFKGTHACHSCKTQAVIINCLQCHEHIKIVIAFFFPS